MASIIEGFNYDIFISYRQKDNKFDGWVTRFVDDLKKELEATFKEDISIYFDANPYDGLLEMHNVDKSLEGKLKSLIFIPIISQTYCDTKSFAWQYEFCAFNRSAKEDQFGRDIKLTGGNVTSRILPVKINDIDPEDLELVEKELGCPLRPIEFIYREPGVNRPLTPEDDEKKNLNNTRYRNQINKVAITVKGIIRAINDPSDETAKRITENVTMKTGRWKGKTTKIYIAGTILFILLLAGIFTTLTLVKKYPGLSESLTDKSIAVLPFKNLSNDPEQEYFTEGMLDEILDRLFKIGDLKVTSRTSSSRFKDSTLPLKEIAHELKVSTILEGSVRKIEKNVRITVQLIDARSDTHLWSEVFDVNLDDLSHVFSIQSEVAQLIAGKLHAVVTPMEKQLIEKVPTKNLEAYEAYLQGMFYWRKLSRNDLENAMKYFELAKEKDPDFALAHAGIGFTWLGLVQMGFVSPEDAGPKGIAALENALRLDSTMDQIHYMTACTKVWSEWDWKNGESEFLRTLVINPNHAEARAYYSHFLNMMGRPKEAMVQIEMALRLDPVSPLIKALYSADLLFVRQYDDAVKVSIDVLKIDPANPIALTMYMFGLHFSGRYSEALKGMKSYYPVIYPGVTNASGTGETKEDYFKWLKHQADTLAIQSKNIFIMPVEICWLYSLAGDIDNGFKWLEEAYKVRDQNLPYLLFPCFDNLRNDKRFQDICRRMNLPC